MLIYLKVNRKFRCRFVLYALSVGLLAAFAGQISAQASPRSMAEAVQKMAVPQAHAERFGALPVQTARGRIVPMNTFSSEIVRKLHKTTRFGQLNSDQFLLSLLAMPEMWMHVPLITYSNNEIAGYFSLPPKKVGIRISNGTCPIVRIRNNVCKKETKQSLLAK